MTQRVINYTTVSKEIKALNSEIARIEKTIERYRAIRDKEDRLHRENNLMIYTADYWDEAINKLLSVTSSLELIRDLQENLVRCL